MQKTTQLGQNAALSKRLLAMPLFLTTRKRASHTNEYLFKRPGVPSSDGAVRRARVQDVGARRPRERNAVDGIGVTPALSTVLTRRRGIQLHRIGRQRHPHQRPIKPATKTLVRDHEKPTPPAARFDSQVRNFNTLLDSRPIISEFQRESDRGIELANGKDYALGSNFEDVVVAEVRLDRVSEPEPSEGRAARI